MGKSSITNIVKADQKNSTEPFGKIKDQLDETQALSWRMEQYMAESRNVLTSCVRLKSELQYDYFTELVLEAAKTSEKLTDKLRRLTLEVTVKAYCLRLGYFTNVANRFFIFSRFQEVNRSSI